MMLSICLFIVCEICEVIRYVAAPGGEWGLIVSAPIHLYDTIGYSTLIFKCPDKKWAHKTS